MTARRDGGFTLLEILVSLMVFSAVAALVYGMVRIGSRSWEASTARIDETEAMRIGWSFVQTSLSDSRPEPSLNPDVPGIHFAGNASAVEYVADLPAYLGRGGPHVLGLQAEPEPESGRWQLTLRLLPLPSAAEGAEAEQSGPASRLQEVVLAEGVAALEIRYYGLRAEEEVPRWHLEWREESSLPLLVSVQLALEDGTHWPILVAHPRLGTPPAGRDAGGTEDAAADGALQQPAGLRREARSSAQ